MVPHEDADEYGRADGGRPHLGEVEQGCDLRERYADEREHVAVEERPAAREERDLAQERRHGHIVDGALRRMLDLSDNALADLLCVAGRLGRRRAGHLRHMLHTAHALVSFCAKKPPASIAGGCFGEPQRRRPHDHWRRMDGLASLRRHGSPKRGPRPVNLLASIRRCRSSNEASRRSRRRRHPQVGSGSRCRRPSTCGSATRCPAAPAR